MPDIETQIPLPLFDTLPQKVAVLKKDNLPTDPNYGGLMDLLSIDVSHEQPEDMGGRGTTRQRVFNGEGGSSYGRYDIDFIAPFSNHFHKKSWEVICVEEGSARIRLGGIIDQEGKELILQNGFAQEIQIEPGDIVIIPPNTPQGIELTTSSLSTKVLMSPPFDRANDSIKFVLKPKQTG